MLRASACCRSGLWWLVALLLACHVFVAAVEEQSPPPPPSSCQGHPNALPIETSAPQLVHSVKNGKRYLAGSGNDTFHVVHLYSDTDDLYEMGFALGQMFPAEIADFFPKMVPWIDRLLEKAVPWLPDWLAKIAVEYGIRFAIDLVYDMTEKYIPPEYLKEWQGIADGAGVDVKDVRYVTLFPQLSKAACTIILSHDSATPTGSAHHLRALDFDATAPVSDYASVVVYHYKSKPQLANFGWLAMTGVLTGQNDVPISVGEKAWGGGHDAPLKLPIGLPWMQELRKSLELTSLSDINEYIVASSTVNDTFPGDSVDIHLGYSDQKSNQVIGYEIGYNYSKSFAWNTHKADPTHPLLEGLVYWTKNDPARTMCPGDMLQKQHGQITAEWLAMYYSPNDETGDTQVVAFDLQGQVAYVANSRKTTSGGNLYAYNRQRTRLDMKAVFSEPAPTL